ncbi:uncharacterized protein LOC126838013 [Adelges cooleyi]|uniref:uncharacterized protein LOC126838013 n=1 Tax=Adelges cooleyi TaxID=133065 RepID=UPI00217F3EF6|nr:uncharacterized protein LOC126838013 [Adelges cooleyi]
MTIQLQGTDYTNKRIILNVVSAYGFGLIKGSIVINATLKDLKLQTPSIFVNKNELKFGCEFIWYMDSLELKKTRMYNESIKIECFRVSNITNIHEKLGYLFLKIKGAQFITTSSNDRVDNKTFKLIGSKNYNYSVTLSLRIEDYNQKIEECTTKKIENLNTHTSIVNIKLPSRLDKNTRLSREVSASPNELKVMEQPKIMSNNNETYNINSYDVQQKYIEELEDWKDQQMILFNEKMKIKEEQLLQEIKNKWLTDKKSIEDELTFQVTKCKEYAENMDKLADMLKEREANITSKELEYAYQKDNLNDKYINVMQNLQSSFVQTIKEFKSKISNLEAKLHQSESHNVLLQKEVQTLNQKIASLENQCDEANKAQMFFKERWITSVRKINRMYTKMYGNQNNEHMSNNKQNIQNVLTNHMVGRQHDEECLQRLLKDLGKLREEMINTNLSI